jgi:Winged helix DNA-binding domain
MIKTLQTPAEPAAPAATPEPDTLTWAEVRDWRTRRYHHQADLRLRTEADARRFIDEVGFCFLFSAPGAELPTLWEAINGKPRAIPKHHHDHALSLAWSWKDSLPARKEVWYGKLLRGKPMFVALDLLPAFYALSENYGELDDYRQQFADGRMSVEAKAVYEVLLENGALSTNAMRKMSGLFGGGETARRFERAVAELQQDLKIVKCGTAEDNRWKYCYVYDLLLRRYPDVAERARGITTRQARQQLVVRYLDNVAAAPVAGLQSLFGWEAGTLRRTVDELLATGRLREVAIPDLPAVLNKPRSRKLKDAAAAPIWLALGPQHGL